jgi:hypothetical protein
MGVTGHPGDLARPPRLRADECPRQTTIKRVLRPAGWAALTVAIDRGVPTTDENSSASVAQQRLGCPDFQEIHRWRG